MSRTPGPWEVRTTYSPLDFPMDLWKTEVSSGLHLVASAYGNKHESMANARLIAAAPEMLEALKEARASLIELGCENRGITRIDAAIAKATGGAK